DTKSAKKVEPIKEAKSAKKEEPIKETKSAKKEEPKKDAKAEKKEEKPVKEAKKEEKPAKKKAEDKKSLAKTKDSKSSSKLSRTKEPAGGKASVAAAVVPDSTKRNMIIIAAVLIFVLVLSIVIVSVVAVRNHKVVIVNPYKNVTRVGYSARELGTVDRYKPVSEIKNEGLSAYPTYGYTLRSVIGTDSDKVASRQALIAESSYLTATGTRNAGGGGYTFMDKDGYLYSGTLANSAPAIGKDGKQRQLYKHTASVGLYLGDVDDKEKGVIKEITMMPRGYTSYGVTGLYAPAGEVIKVTLSEEDMKATGGIVIHIGQALYNGQANNIWDSKNAMNRIPHLLNTLAMTTNTMEYDEDTHTYTGYIGSFIGGPIYIRNESATFTVTISGGVTYSHFILGYTSPEEFEKNKDSSVPYFDLEVWEYGVLHSGPKNYAKAFDYEQLYNAAVFWEKVSLSTTSRGNGYYQGIVFLYDPFVAAGGAVAFPGRSSVNCPMDWMASSLNYESVIAAGSWGNFHEYHHNFQGFGVGDDGEVTNNSLNLVAYSLYTKISSSRHIASYGGAGLSGWNCYTSATWALERVNQNAITSTNGLAVYSTLLHNFGPDAYLKCAKGSNNTYWNYWANYTHQDMSYYASLVSRFAVNSSPETLHKQQSDYPMFVPVSSVYQTGRSYTYDGEKKYFESMQPYVITYGEDFTVDLSPYTVNDGGQYMSGSVVMPSGFSYKIKEVKADGINGSFVSTDDPFIYTFKPNKELLSGKIYVTLEITNESNTVGGDKFTVDDVDLVLEFEQSHETNRSVLERTTYTYEAGKAYTDAVEAYNAGFKGYSSVVEGDNVNPVQNSNTDIWYYPATDAYKNDEAKSKYVVPLNSVAVVSGKLYIEEAGKYRIVMRGRMNCAMYLKYNEDEDYSLAAKIQDKSAQSNSTSFRLKDSVNNDTYADIVVDENKSWVYFKIILITYTATSNASFIGLGIAQWTVPLYTTSEDADGNTHYYDASGKEVTAEQASNVEPITPTRISYASAYRQSYDFPKEFTSEYFVKRSYSSNYTNNVSVPTESYQLESTNYTATGYGSGLPIENLTDGNRGTYIHTSWRVSASKPLELVYNLGEPQTVNRLTVTARNHNGMGEGPKDFTIFGSNDGSDYFLVGEYTNVPTSNNQVVVNFEDATFKYFKLVITNAQTSGYYLVLGEIILTHAFEVFGGKMYSPDNDMFTYRGAGKWTLVRPISNFGHVYLGKNKAVVEFEFEGSRVGIMSSTAYGSAFEVKIDGKTVRSISLKEAESGTFMSYLSPELESGKHKVKVVCKGKANIDSFVLFPSIEPAE
ncbi:MAG: M60 family metallopeptidase, partial [Clostridia bacterium]|nr:M60 family metallopeptidase [Clostridia bacterium]